MKHHVFIIGSVWVEPNSSAAGSRMLQLITSFLSKDWRVTFGTVSHKNPNSIDLSKLGVKEVRLELNSTSFDEFITDLKPTIVIFDRFITEEQFGWRVAEYCPKTLRILDTEDLHCLRKTRHEALKKGIEFSNEMLLNSEISKREITAIYRCDISLIISTFEMKLLREVFKIDKSLLYHLPFLFDKIDENNSWKPFDERHHFVSIGNFLHAPNLDATIQLKKYIWKEIRKRLPAAQLHVYGAYPTQQVLEFTNANEGFFVHGFVENAFEVLQNSRVLLAPLRFGAGIKGKLSNAMLCGTPSVTSSIGSEGMNDEIPWSGFVEDEIANFVEKSVLLYTDKIQWNQAQQRGIEIINTKFHKEQLTYLFFRCIDQVFSNLEQHRNNNFTGKMLLHHSLQSSKYMSKWIEEKNRKDKL
ncbi:glycosyltransferase family 4 protein [Flavobacteriaceae bacterium]|nr:glycosyltransferase family 4 protein [Flavobacteriaceae bacterium]MDB2413508.1 glycosyltransferase family 4 protein [Flavobacteriaceae bacterium]